MKKIGLVLLLVMMVLISGCTYGPRTEVSSQPTTTPMPPTTPTEMITSTATSTATVTSVPVAIEIKNFAFNPSTITIPKGTTVIWTQNDSVPHTVTTSVGKGFDSGTLNPGDTFSWTFNDVGTFSYGCSIHPNMMGTIIVT
jgi:plastocyanin